MKILDHHHLLLKKFLDQISFEESAAKIETAEAEDDVNCFFETTKVT
jgi:hypothetical protein